MGVPTDDVALDSKPRDSSAFVVDVVRYRSRWRGQGGIGSIRKRHERQDAAAQGIAVGRHLCCLPPCCLFFRILDSW